MGEVLLVVNGTTCIKGVCTRAQHRTTRGLLAGEASEDCLRPPTNYAMCMTTCRELRLGCTCCAMLAAALHYHTRIAMAARFLLEQPQLLQSTVRAASMQLMKILSILGLAGSGRQPFAMVCQGIGCEQPCTQQKSRVNGSSIWGSLKPRLPGPRST